MMGIRVWTKLKHERVVCVEVDSTRYRTTPVLSGDNQAQKYASCGSIGVMHRGFLKSEAEKSATLVPLPLVLGAAAGYPLVESSLSVNVHIH